MASTYSSLKIQLMATGENTGTWGNVTNTNLGTALEEAIVGSADVAFSSADVTLTLTDTNTSQTARNMRLNLTGTSGGARNLTVPAIEKIYAVRNGLADTVTVKNATGATIAIPAGKTMWVYSTGSGVVDVVTHLTSLTLETALPIASGGTGTTSTTYCNLQANVTGTLPNSNTTASASNGSSTIVARDGSGNFTANTGTFTTVIGAGSGLTSLNASNLASGTVATARLASGTANNTTFLRGDSTWTALSSPNNGTLTMNVSGNGLSGSATFTADQAGNSTFTVASNATNANGANTIVARDASGNFNANVITATLNGNATTATTATTATNATNATNATQITNSGGWNITPNGTNLFFNYNGTNVAVLTSAGNLTVIGDVTAYGTI